jgi:hypothetical protein
VQQADQMISLEEEAYEYSIMNQQREALSETLVELLPEVIF